MCALRAPQPDPLPSAAVMAAVHTLAAAVASSSVMVMMDDGSHGTLALVLTTHVAAAFLSRLSSLAELSLAWSLVSTCLARRSSSHSRLSLARSVSRSRSLRPILPTSTSAGPHHVRCQLVAVAVAHQSKLFGSAAALLPSL